MTGIWKASEPKTPDRKELPKSFREIANELGVEMRCPFGTYSLQLTIIR